MLRDIFGASAAFDLVLLGIGDNGHTASLFPGLAAVSEPAAWVMAQYVEVAGMWRITLTPPAINAAREIVFLVAGADKAEVLHRVIDGPLMPVVLPSQAIVPVKGRLCWLVDAAAASGLAAR
jgi:6-phosphogluconolactonase